MLIPVLIFNNRSGKFPLDFCIGLRKNEWNKIILLSNCFFHLGLGTLIRITTGQLNRNLNSNIFVVAYLLKKVNLLSNEIIFHHVSHVNSDNL